MLVLAVMATTAAADPRRLDVVGDACDTSSLADQVASDPDAIASVHVELVAPFAARISFDDGDGHVIGPRVIDAASCDELVASVALVIAMTPAHAKPLAPIPEPAPEITRTIVAPAPPRIGRWDALAGGAGSIDTGGLVERVALGARYRRGDRSIAAELRGDLPDEHALASGRVDVLRAELAIVPCLHRGAFAACGLAVAGLWRGSGIGLVTEQAAFAPELAVGARIAWETALTARLGLRAHLDADALVTTTRFDVDAMPVWTSPRVEATAGLSLIARFL